MSNIPLTLKAEALINYFIKKITAQFNNRVIAIFKLGSLGAHGDFSLCSDVDVALMLDKIIPSDYDVIKTIWDEIKTSNLEYADRLSVFWISYQADDFSKGAGRFPPLDRLDLLQGGVLIYGSDKRNTLPKPTETEIILASAEFLNSFLLSNDKLEELISNPVAILKKGTRYFTKFVLFPVRLLFTIDKPSIVASNREAVEHFINTINQDTDLSAMEINLVKRAYELRNQPADAPVTIVEEAFLRASLAKIYCYCIQQYLTAIAALAAPGTATELQARQAKLQPFC